MKHDEILEILAWIDPAMRLAARACSSLELTLYDGQAYYRPLAARLVGVDP